MIELERKTVVFSSLLAAAAAAMMIILSNGGVLDVKYVANKRPFGPTTIRAQHSNLQLLYFYRRRGIAFSPNG